MDIGTYHGQPLNTTLAHPLVWFSSNSSTLGFFPLALLLSHGDPIGGAGGISKSAKSR